MPECQTYGCLNKAGEGAGKGKRFFQKPNATKFPAKHDPAIKWLHNIGTGHTVDKFNFHHKVVCEDHFTEQCFKKDVEHVLLGLPELRLLKEFLINIRRVQALVPPKWLESFGSLHRLWR